MNSTGTYLAVFTCSKTGSKATEWRALPEEEQRSREQKGLAAWHAWVEKHKAEIVFMGGPLGATKKISAAGVEDVVNGLGGFTVVRADSHETAAQMFENHPHFAIFPGDAVEVMPVLAIPGA
jgi:hypothetical protein